MKKSYKERKRKIQKIYTGRERERVRRVKGVQERVRESNAPERTIETCLPMQRGRAVVLLQGETCLVVCCCCCELQRQCDQIGQFIGLRATFQRLWQQLICPNLLHSQAILVKVSKYLSFLVKSFLGNSLVIFFLVTLVAQYTLRSASMDMWPPPQQLTRLQSPLIQV